ncbi:hypothetical protein [Nonomuraea indica]|uniref:hypothetical protein n=1 Tax=Nonomuraea indica TaxID=1581193 RepID=UPI000C7E162D|nr:hypothetical protein [Nonomuraea indica]
MKRVVKLSGGIAALVVAAGMFFSPATAATAADDPSIQSTPVRLYELGQVKWSRNTWGIFYDVNIYADRLTAGNWSGYAQDNTGRRLYFCDGYDLRPMNNYIKTMFISRTKASWCR